MPEFPRHADQWYVGGLLIMAASLPLSRAALSLSYGILLLIHLRYFPHWWKRSLQTGWWYWGMGMLVLFGIGMFHSQDQPSGWDLIRAWLPLGLLPWMMAVGPRLSNKQLTAIAHTFLGACGLISLLALLLAAVENGTTGSWSLESFTYTQLTERVDHHPTFLGLMLNVSALLAIWLQNQLPRRPYWLWLVAVLGMHMLLGARMQQLLFGGIVLVGGGIWSRNRKEILRSVLIGVGVLAVLVGALLSVPSSRERLNQVWSPKTITNMQELPYDGVAVRKYLWRVAWEVCLEAPLLGHGTGDAQLALQPAFERDGFPRPTMNAHQQWLDLGLKLGFLGMLALTIGWGWGIWICWKNKTPIGIAIFLLLALSGTTEVLLTRQWGIATVALWGAWAISLSDQNQ
ncbi:MAG: O-antigen ligase family protein [Bacteroidota bacterium]